MKDFGVEVLGSLFEGKNLEEAVERGYVRPNPGDSFENPIKLISFEIAVV